jgi:hypothetical protein
MNEGFNSTKDHVTSTVEKSQEVILEAIEQRDADVTELLSSVRKLLSEKKQQEELPRPSLQSRNLNEDFEKNLPAEISVSTGSSNINRLSLSILGSELVGPPEPLSLKKKLERNLAVSHLMFNHTI